MGRFPEGGFSHPFVDMNTVDHRTMFKPRCLDEQTIERISAAIRAKPDWQKKSEEESIVSRWREELRAQAPVMPPPLVGEDEHDEVPRIKESLIEYALEELEYFKRLEEQFGEEMFVTGVNEHIFIGHNPVDESVKTTLQELAVRHLEDSGEKDWHPGTNEQVLDLVHPSLYPIQYKLTPVLPQDYENKIGLECGFDRLKDCSPLPTYIYPSKHNVEQYGISMKFQWLPAIFAVDANGRVDIKSYINNLHPERHKELYDPIARVFERAIPGINGALSVYANPQRVRIPPLDEYQFYAYPKEFDDVIEEVGEEVFDELEEQGVDMFRLRGTPIVREPKWGGVPDIEPVDVRDSRLKVIVKLANIQLTPENPDYPGGTWHVEGTINEDIVATVLYYYDSINITDSRLAFRISQEQPIYEQYDHYGVHKVFGLKDEQRLSYNIGSVPCKEDSIVVFPNCFQHQVQPFSLQDKTKPGHRKILCFFICDPTDKKVVATDRVPAQQSEWWEDYSDNPLPGFLDKADWPKDFEHAKQIREELMKERSIQQSDEPDHPFLAGFSLCEH
ncbi:hypothetical protein TRICI_003146 [Trichomonascus ciferrii]|uniref:Uncharacterized protein n=1 Tax=Trichomonascus ciferrii TaxID=44093 RepID=A0A642V9U5_9ASCO|nr:hypothetical protein TRICI_003146 [Trichomonascus ciferrii]